MNKNVKAELDRIVSTADIITVRMLSACGWCFNCDLKNCRDAINRVSTTLCGKKCILNYGI